MIIDQHGNPIQAAVRMDERSPRMFMFSRSHAGQWVDHDSIMTIGAVNACVRVVAETIGVLDWHVFQVDRGTRARSKRTDLLLDRLLSLQPNREMTAKTLKEVLVGHMMIYGNGYAEIVKDSSGRVTALWPLRPDRVFPKRDDNGDLYYEVHALGEKIPMLPEEIFHLKGFGFDGMRGYDVVSYMMEAAGYALAVETFAATFFGNGAHSSGALTYNGKSSLSPEAKEKLREDIDRVHRGAGNAHKLFILEGGEWDFKNLSITPEQAQMIESRKMSVEDVARWLRVPLHKIGHLERAHFNNVEQLGIQFVTDTILPVAVSLEQEANVKLLGGTLRTDHHTKLNLTALTRGDLNSRMQAYRIGREIGVYSANDIRDMEGMDPISEEEGGNIFIVPMNFQEAKALMAETERKQEAPDLGVDGVMPAAALRAACDNVIDREDMYFREESGRDTSLKSLAENHRAFAENRLAPIISDVFKALGRDGADELRALERICDDYAFAVVNRWANYREPPDLSTQAVALEHDVKRIIGGYLT